MSEVVTNPFGSQDNLTGTHQGRDTVADDLMKRYPFPRGRVIAVGFESSGWGRYVVIRWVKRDNTVRLIAYCHFEEVYVQPMQLIWGGTVIGKEGKTGRVIAVNGDGTHCHEEMYAPVDPEIVLAEGRNELGI